MSAAATDIVSSVRISEVWRALGGGQLRHGRGQAWWRDGDGFSIALRDDRNVWHDKRDNGGGGVLDLIALVRGGSRQDALRWLAEFAGLPLDDRPMSLAERNEWAQRKRLVERDLPRARYWRRAAVALGEEVLDRLKDGLFDPVAANRPDIGELQEWTARLELWQRIDGAALVAEYRDWVEQDPRTTAGLVITARLLETAERRAIGKYLRLTEEDAT
jgi:hypothetical protein